MRRRRSTGRRTTYNQASVAVWGVHTWNSNRTWGHHDSNWKRVQGDRMSGDAIWGWGYWVTDFYLRW